MDNQEQPQSAQPAVEIPVENTVPASEEPAPQPVQPDKTPEELFLDRYKALCSETGLELSIEPKLVLDPQGHYDTSKFSVAVSVRQKVQ